MEKAHENTLRLAVILEFSDDCVSSVLRDMPLYNTELSGGD